MADNIRKEKIASAIQKSLSEIISRLKNPHITDMVSVVKVQVSGDLKHAKVFLSIYGEESKKQTTFDAIVHSGGYIKKEMAAYLKDMRFLPDIVFVLDDSMDYGAKIDKLINEIKNKDNV